jgi:arylsulfatase A-like enzyme
VKTFLKAIGYTLSTLVVVALVFAAYGAVKIKLYEQTDDPTHLKEKLQYLRELQAAERLPHRPNIVFVLYDDMGYGDLGITGADAIRTPNIDQLAEQGARLTNFYSPSPVCTPSRFGFLTGRHAERGQLAHVVFPEGHAMSNFIKLRDANIRIPAYEITLPEVLKSVGYTTGMVGKWHLGDVSPSLPNDMGFDTFYGALYSNDMLPFAIYKNGNIVIESPADQTLLSEAYAKASTNFIRKNSESPFFLYLAHNFPHEPLHVRASRLGQSAAGLYGDVVEELDKDIGSLVAALRDEGVLDNTLIIITSDNGPWYLGNPGPARGRKGDTFEGGMHVPFIAHWPSKIQAGQVIDGLAMGTDLLPTILSMLNLPKPDDRILDGKSILNMLTNKQASPHDYLYYYSGKLLAIRDSDYKFVPKRGIHYGMATLPIGVAVPKGPYLFDMRHNGNESYDIQAHKPEVFQRFEQLYQQRQKSMADNRGGWQ